jgi:hypothetical protein
MVIEIMTFRVPDGTDEAAFLAADGRVQAAVSSREGFVRRTTARAAEGDGRWLVVTMWGSEDDALAAPGPVAADPAMAAFLASVDTSTVWTQRYVTLD